jgi:hypothetical protein
VVSRVRDGGVYAGAEQGCALAWIRGTASAGCMCSVRWGIFSLTLWEHTSQRGFKYMSPGSIADSCSVRPVYGGTAALEAVLSTAAEPTATPKREHVSCFGA